MCFSNPSRKVDASSDEENEDQAGSSLAVKPRMTKLRMTQ